MLDAIHYKVREEGAVVKRAVYIAVGTDLAGKKDVLGLWVGATEGSEHWLGGLHRRAGDQKRAAALLHRL